MPTTESTQTVENYTNPVSAKAHDNILIIIDGENVPHRHQLEDELKLGRSKTNDIVLDDEAISRKHLRVKRDGEKYIVVDLGSTNGVFIEDKRVHPNAEVEWEQKQILRAGPFYLSWQPRTAKYKKPALIIGSSAPATRPSRPMVIEDVALPNENLIDSPSDEELSVVAKDLSHAEEIDLLAEAEVDAEFARFLEQDKWEAIEEPETEIVGADPLEDLYPDMSELAEMEKLVQNAEPSLASIDEDELAMPSVEMPSELSDVEDPAMPAIAAAAQDIAPAPIVETEPMAEIEAAPAVPSLEEAMAAEEDVASALSMEAFRKQLPDDTQSTADLEAEDSNYNTQPVADTPTLPPMTGIDAGAERTELAFPDEIIKQDRLEMEQSLENIEPVDPFDEMHPERTEVAFGDVEIDRDRLEMEQSIDPMSEMHAERTEVAFGDRTIDRDRLEMDRDLPALGPVNNLNAERTEIAYMDRDSDMMRGAASQSIAEPTQVAMVSAEQLAGRHETSDSADSILTLKPGILVLEPGQRAEIEIDIVNITDKTEEYSLHVEDMPRTWFALSRESLELRPQERGTVTISLNVPEVGARAGLYNYSVYAEAMSNALEIVRAAGELEVKSHHDFEFNVARSAKRDGAIYYVSIHNKGNENDVYHVDRVDGDNTVDLQARNWDMALPPESKDSLRIVAVPVKRPLFGKTRSVPFELQVTSRSGYAQNHLDEVEVTPYLTFGMLIWLLIAVALGFTLVWTFLTYVTQSAGLPDAAMAVEVAQQAAAIIART